ncbi:hypothetical protein BAnh1_02340 [Bartonella australis AUST/NH1]|uniref:Uncharacterized protein n=2 Tax=Bartonella australis TaxID=388640 RepID=M1PBW0_BARAA|nr:hypothetical protein BAnh1_02340 [Bartonella australis AUST/NH1]
MMAIRADLAQARRALGSEATGTEFKELLQVLFGGMRLPRDVDSRQASGAYLLALTGVPSVIFRYAVTQILKGEVDDLHKTYAPTAPELAAYCKNLGEQMVSKITSIERILRAPEQQAVAPRISEEKFQLLSHQLKQMKVMG